MFELEPGEYVIAHFRKHWFRFFLAVLPVIIVALLPFIFPTLLTVFAPSAFKKVQAVTYFFLFLWLLATFIWGMIMWTNYYLNVWVLTNHRIISAEQKNLFIRHMSTLELTHIQDVTIEVNGFLETLIGYGTLIVQTAGEHREFIIDDCGNPERAKQLIYQSQQASLHADVSSEQFRHPAPESL